jgi:polar amino acid transport system substrate-binding protein
MNVLLPIRLGLAAIALSGALMGGAQAAEPAPTPQIARALAPSGTLRAAINLGNAVLAQKASNGDLKGVTVDLARELGRRLGTPVVLVPFQAAGEVFGALKDDRWDVAFIAIEPVRAAEVDFSSPYALLEATYMVRKDSPLREIDDADRSGVRIAVGRGSAYDLYLTRTLKNATVVRAATGGNTAMIDLFLKDRLEAVAGIRQQLAPYAAADPGLRIVPGSFQAVPQAVGIPKGREAGAAYVSAFVEEAKASGFVAKSLAASGQARRGMGEDDYGFAHQT